MELRLIEVYLPNEDAPNVRARIEQAEIYELWEHQAEDGRTLLRVLAEAGHTESILDVLEDRCKDEDGYRVLLTDVLATLPRIEENSDSNDREGSSASQGNTNTNKVHGRERVSREELRQELSAGLQITPVYLMMVVLSTIVAAGGLIRGNTAIVIGAMVIAPLLVPNMALALATVLGEFASAQRALLTNAVGAITTLALSAAMGLLLPVDTGIEEIAIRTRVGTGDVVLALAAGTAGALAFVTAVPAGLVGVMVAVALLPPLVVTGLLIGAGQHELAFHAFLLLAINVLGINLSGIVVFVLQGLGPHQWWVAARTRRITWLIVLIWLGLLAMLIWLIHLSRT